MVGRDDRERDGFLQSAVHDNLRSTCFGRPTLSPRIEPTFVSTTLPKSETRLWSRTEPSPTTKSSDRTLTERELRQSPEGSVSPKKKEKRYFVEGTNNIQTFWRGLPLSSHVHKFFTKVLLDRKLTPERLGRSLDLPRHLHRRRSGTKLPSFDNREKITTPLIPFLQFTDTLQRVTTNNFGLRVGVRQSVSPPPL